VSNSAPATVIKQSEILFSLIPGWFFILRGYYFKGFIYFFGFIAVLSLGFFYNFLPSYFFIRIAAIIWGLSIFDSIMLFKEYNIKTEPTKVIHFILRGKYPFRSANFPFYFVEFYNNLRYAEEHPAKFSKQLSKILKIDLPPDWYNLLHYYKSLHFH
jgi:hypothetical protein